MSERPDLAGDSSLAGIIALLGFVLVATAQVTNMILARGLAGRPRCGRQSQPELLRRSSGDEERPSAASRHASTSPSLLRHTSPTGCATARTELLQFADATPEACRSFAS